MRRLSLILALAVAILLAPAAGAHASVLLDFSRLNPKHRGKPAYLGAWYRTWDSGSRKIKVRLFRGRKLVKTRRIVAPDEWRFYSVGTPTGSGSWSIRVSGAGWHVRKSIRVPRR